MLARAMRYDHMAFPSFDVEATHHFYKDVLGFALVTAYSGMSPEWGNKAYVMMIYDVGGGEQLVFFGLAGMKRPPKDGLPRDIRHVALTAPSASALAQWRKRLVRSRVAFWEEDHGNQQSIYFSDPNGLVLEVTFPASRKALLHDESAESVVTEWIRRQARSGGPAKARRGNGKAPSATQKAPTAKSARKRN
jgi:catechol 2,3-dioxygenase-like lactoylglutathione lyase family enzyme